MSYRKQAIKNDWLPKTVIGKSGRSRFKAWCMIASESVPDAPVDRDSGAENIKQIFQPYFAALWRISRMRCPNKREGGCAKELALAMGGTLPLREQRRRYCAACIAKEALQC